MPRGQRLLLRGGSIPWQKDTIGEDSNKLDYDLADHRTKLGFSLKSIPKEVTIIIVVNALTNHHYRKEEIDHEIWSSLSLSLCHAILQQLTVHKLSITITTCFGSTVGERIPARQRHRRLTAHTLSLSLMCRLPQTTRINKPVFIEYSSFDWETKLSVVRI